MRSHLKVLLASATIAAVTAVMPSAAQDDAEAIIKYRQALMKAQAGHLGAMFQIAGGKAGKAEHLEAHAHGLNEVSRMVADAFMTKTDGDKTRALPEIWTDWADFEQKSRDMEAAAAEVLAAAEAGDAGMVGAKLKAAGDACGACHKKFRAKE